MPLVLVAGPQEEPISVEEARDHLRVTSTAYDFTIATLIAAAREWAEGFTHRKLVTQTWDWKMDAFPASPSDVPLAPLQSVSSISYVDENGDAQTVPSASYEVDSASEPGRIQLAVSGASWPTLPSVPVLNAVAVRIVVGHGASSKVFETIKLAMKLHVEAHFDRDKDMMKVLLEAAENLVTPHIIYTIPK